jgi:Bacterial PH domain
VTPHKTTHQQAPEHEFEAEHGLPEPLPSGERLLWQGSPEWRVLAREALHTRALTIYFAIVLAFRGATVLGNDGTLADAVQAVLWLLPLAVAAIALLSLIAWLISRTSVYTITDKRVVMRIGVVLSITFNLPYAKIESAGLRSNLDGSGDVTLVLEASEHIAYLHLWPHARPWQVRRTQPMLRALADARGVAAILSAALADSAGVARTGLPASTSPERQRAGNGGRQPLAA